MRVIKQPKSMSLNDGEGVPEPISSMSQIYMSDKASPNVFPRNRPSGGVRIPLRVMVSRGFEEEKHPDIIKLPILGEWPLLPRIILTACLGSFLFGFNIALLNTCLETISMDFHWCLDPIDTGCKTALLYKSITNTTVFVGGALGAMTGGRLLFIGRRMAILLTMTVFCFGITSSVVADSLSTLVWGRLIVGYGVGVVSVVVPTYISEMSPSECRGYYGTFHQLMNTFGIFIAVLIGLPLAIIPKSTEKAAYVLPQFHRIWWRTMLGLGFVPVLLCMYVLIYVMRFETPHYYVENGYENEARKILRRLHCKENVEPALLSIIRARDDAMEAQQNGLTFAKAMRQHLYSRVIIVGIMLASLQQLCGITVFISSSNDLLAQAKLDSKLITITSVFIAFVNFIMTVPAIFLMDALGRKTLMIIGTVGMGFSVLPATVLLWLRPDKTYTTWSAIAGSIFFIFFFAFSYGPVLWVYLFEIYPVEIKGMASGIATASNWIFGIAVVFSARFLPVKYNFAFFCVMSFATSIYVWLEMRETKGRSLENSPYLE